MAIEDTARCRPKDLQVSFGALRRRIRDGNFAGQAWQRPSTEETGTVPSPAPCPSTAGLQRPDGMWYKDVRITWGITHQGWNADHQGATPLPRTSASLNQESMWITALIMPSHWEYRKDFAKGAPLDLFLCNRWSGGDSFTRCPVGSDAEGPPHRHPRWVAWIKLFY